MHILYCSAMTRIPICRVKLQLVKPGLAAHKPPTLSALLAACCPTSAVTAYYFVREVAHVREGDRVLVLGGSGGVGSAAVQLSKLAGASFVATITTQESMLLALGADAALDYHTADWWTHPEFIETPFDVVRALAHSERAIGEPLRYLVVHSTESLLPTTVNAGHRLCRRERPLAARASRA